MEIGAGSRSPGADVVSKDGKLFCVFKSDDLERAKDQILDLLNKRRIFSDNWRVEEAQNGDGTESSSERVLVALQPVIDAVQQFLPSVRGIKLSRSTFESTSYDPRVENICIQFYGDTVCKDLITRNTIESIDLETESPTRDFKAIQAMDRHLQSPVDLTQIPFSFRMPDSVYALQARASGFISLVQRLA